MSYYQSGSQRAENTRRLFSKIARHYDCINDLQSLGLHRRWKQEVIESFPSDPNSLMLDLACGTGDLTIRMLLDKPSYRVMGGDYTLPMLKVAQHRAKPLLNPPWGLIHLNGLSLPFRDNSLKGIMMAYGLRNMPDIPLALKEIHRTLQPGGRLALLDFGKPGNPLVRKFYHFMLQTVQPFLGWLFFRDTATYGYIMESLEKYPAQEGISRLLQDLSFKEITCKNLTLGTMSLHTAVK